MSGPIRVGAVSYLNAKPLYYDLCELVLCKAVHGRPQPAGGAAGGGELDVALIPSVEYLRGGPGL